MLYLQVLTALHIIGACVFVGSAALLMRITKRVEAIPPREATRLSELLGGDLALLNALSILVLGVTGFLRMVEQNTLAGLWDSSFLWAPYGAAMVVMIVLWLLVVASTGLMVFYLRPRLAIQIPFDGSRQVADGGGGGALVVRRPRRAHGRMSERARAFLQLKDSSVMDLLDLRMSIECKLAARAARRISESDASELIEVSTAMADGSVSDWEFATLDGQLHRIVLRAAQSPTLTRRYLSVQNRFQEYSLKVLKLPERRRIAQEGHAKLVQAIIVGNPRGARRAAREHLAAVRDQVREEVLLIDHLDSVGLEQLRSDSWINRMVMFNLVVGVLTLVDAGFLSYGGFG